METITQETKVSVNPYAKTMRPGVKNLMIRAGGAFRYARVLEKMFEDYCKEMTGYERIATFVNDFALAEAFGDNAILDTYRRAEMGWLKDYKYMTELVMSLNWLCWFWHYNKDPELSQLYGDLYYRGRDAFYEHNETQEGDPDEVIARKEEAVRYFFECTD